MREVRGSRRVFGRFPDHAVTGDQCRRDLSDVQEDGVVPRADDADDAPRPMVHDIAATHEPRGPQSPGNFSRLQYSRGFSFQELEGRSRRQQFRSDHFGGRAADVRGDHFADFIRAIDEEMPEFADRLQPFPNREPRPQLLGRPARGHFGREGSCHEFVPS